MIDLLDIKEKLIDTGEALAKTVRAQALHPDDFTIRLTAISLRKLHGSLEEKFLQAARASQVGVCSYRIIPDGHSKPVTINMITSVLEDFQKWVSLAFHALKNGPQSRADVPAEIAKNTAFNFGYTFPGSVGFVFTLSDEQLLFGESDLDVAIDTVLEMARETSSEGIRHYARKLGSAPIKTMKAWADAHAKAHSSASIDWYKGRTGKSSLFMQWQELDRLREVIAATSDTTEKELQAKVELHGIDVDRRRFSVVLPTGNRIDGSFSPDLTITKEQSVNVPHSYDARIITRTTVNFATGEEKTEHILKSLTPA